MGLQTLSYYGYVKVDHTKLQSDFERAMDLNKDGKVRIQKEVYVC